MIGADDLRSFVATVALQVDADAKALTDPATVADTLQQALSHAHFAGMLHTLQAVVCVLDIETPADWIAFIDDARARNQKAARDLTKAALTRADAYIDDQLTSTVVLSANRQN